MVKYSGSPDNLHDRPICTGILLTNLGTPDAPTTVAVRRYLAEFLSDPRVIELAKPLWWMILHGIILRTRPRRSAQAYRKIWAKEGSPLLTILKKQTGLVEDALQKQIGDSVKVELAMRYGSSSISSALEKLRQANVQRLLVLPLYPQYSATTTASTIDAVAKVLKTWRYIPELRTVNHYHDYPPYIDALVESIRDHWAEHGKPDKLLFSFHGIPKKYELAGDPYYCHCQTTVRLVIEQLGMDEDKWALSFHSRFGLLEWLKPYTDKILKEWGKADVGSIQIICPGFSADCLETLEEINIQNREFFLEAGGKGFSYISALNDQSVHISALTELIVKHCHGWPAFPDNNSKQQNQDELKEALASIPSR